MSDTPRTFEFLLNTMESASQAKSPFEAKYGYKRKAVFNYVEGLERELAEAQAGIECAQQVEQVLRERIAELEPDAERYRWLRDTRRPTVPAGMSAHWGRSNRVPHITQYPYQKDIDDFKFPQIDHTRPETIDAAIDAARKEPNNAP